MTANFNAKSAKLRKEREEIEAIAADIVDSSIKVHRALGPGLLEGVYENCVSIELRSRGHKVDQQMTLPVQYEGHKIEQGFRIDILVDDAVVIEVKAVEKMLPVHLAQTMTYLRLGDFNLGLLLNFNVPMMKDGIKRVVNNL